MNNRSLFHYNMVTLSWTEPQTVILDPSSQSNKLKSFDSSSPSSSPSTGFSLEASTGSTSEGLDRQAPIVDCEQGY